MAHNHEQIMQKMTGKMPKDNHLQDLAELFKIFGDYTRIRILYALFESDLCVKAITEILAMNQSAISHQLRVLKDNRLVDSRRDGKEQIYFLIDDHVRSIINQGFEHILEEK